jgi:hypothetical protein
MAAEEAVTRLRDERYPDANVVLLAGSVVRGEATVSSDLDLVVISARVEHAYRESLHYGGWPVEVFVHDPETLHHFFTEVDRPTGVVPLAYMVAEGRELPVPSLLGGSLKWLARQVIDAGPPVLDPGALRMRRYVVTDLVDDLRAPRSDGERVAIGARLHDALAELYLRSRGLWSARGKHVPRALAAADPEFATRFVAAFDALFTRHEAAQVIVLAEDALAPLGGFLFEGHRLDAPSGWRKPLPR